MRTSKWKYFYYSESEREALYNMFTDPHELDNIATEYPNIVADLRGQLLSQLDVMKERSELFWEGEGSGQSEISPEHLEALRALGYVD